jgi:hypothetical protein
VVKASLRPRETEQVQSDFDFHPSQPQFRRSLAGPQYSQPTRRPSTYKTSGFTDFLNVLEAETIAFGRPVALMHGDTHYFRIDEPLFDSKAKAAGGNSARGPDDR